MAHAVQPVIIKKYATRRLYNTATSAYITRDDIAAMAKAGADFVVHDAKTGEDITRLVLMQVIVEQEKAAQHNLLPTTLLRQLIRLQTDGMQLMVGRYLEMTLELLQRSREESPASAKGTPRDCCENGKAGREQ